MKATRVFIGAYSPPESYDVNWIAERDLAEGVRIVFHLRNHGFNSYKFVSLEASPAP